MISTVEVLEKKYPYLRGHIFTLVQGSRSVACALCGALQREHPVDRQGTGERQPIAEVQSILAEIDLRSKKVLP